MKFSDISEEHTTSSFTIKEYAKQTANTKQATISVCFLVVFCLTYSTTLMTETVFSSEISVTFYHTTLYFVLFNVRS
jgi:uncharacterized membrane protein YbaN (DUF454 family)